MSKEEMRKHIFKTLSRIDPADRAARSASVARRLAETEEWKQAGTVLAFLSMPSELDTRPILSAARASGKAVAVPRIDGDNMVFHYLDENDGPLRTGSLGQSEPAESWPVFDPRRPRGTPAGILVAAPGLAFDRRGNRLGRGKGFYDRFLRKLKGTAAGPVSVIAVAFSEQLVAEVPHDPLDEPINAIVTDSETIRAGD
jgi:5-formyltetrahydrofolate cyclo-ligase